jgi:hypothetical protein
MESDAGVGVGVDVGVGPVGPEGELASLSPQDIPATQSTMTQQSSSRIQPPSSARETESLTSASDAKSAAERGQERLRPSALTGWQNERTYTSRHEGASEVSTVSRVAAIGLAVAAAVPLVYVSTWSAFSELANFADPCFLWGHQSGVLSPDELCPSISATSETKMRVVLRLLLVQGTAVVAACLGLIGAFRARPRVTVFGAILLFLLSIPMMVSFGPFVFGLAVTLLLSSLLSRYAIS